jgi:hypothetical protein
MELIMLKRNFAQHNSKIYGECFTINFLSPIIKFAAPPLIAAGKADLQDGLGAMIRSTYIAIE